MQKREVERQISPNDQSASVQPLEERVRGTEMDALAPGAMETTETALPQEEALPSQEKPLFGQEATDSQRLSALVKKMDGWAADMERLRLSDYISYLDDRKRVIRTSFLGGLARGVGMAVGFTLLGALIILFLQDLAKQNLPLIGDALVRVLEIVQNNMHIQ